MNNEIYTGIKLVQAGELTVSDVCTILGCTKDDVVHVCALTGEYLDGLVVPINQERRLMGY